MNLPSPLKKMPIAPNRLKARDILQQAGYSFRSSKEIINRYIKDILKVDEEELYHTRYIPTKVWKEIVKDYIGHENLITLGYEW